jgi:hypothetical protein
MRFCASPAQVASLWQGVLCRLIDMTMQPVHVETWPDIRLQR